MPLPSWLMSLVFAVAGPSWPAAQVPGMLAGTGLALLTYAIGRNLLADDARGRMLAAFGAVLVALNGVLAYQSVSGDSSALFCVLAAGAIWLAGSASGARPVLAAGGTARGLAALTPRLISSWRRHPARTRLPGPERRPLCVGRPGHGGPSWTRGWLDLALAAGRSGRDDPGGVCAVAAPWLLRNTLEFGTPTPVPAALLASLTRYEDLFNYGIAAPIRSAVGLDAFQALALRAGALWHNWHQVLDFLFFPSALLPLLGLWLLRARSGVKGALAALGVTLAATAILFPVPAMAGTFYHDAGAFAPWLALGLVVLARRVMMEVAARRRWRSDLLGLALLVILVVTVAQLALSVTVVSAQHRAEARRLAEAAAYLGAHPAAPVISTAPYNLTFLTGYPGLMLPVLQEPRVVLSLAERYGARYLVVAGRYGLYPEVLGGAPDCTAGLAAGSGFCRAADGDGWRVFEIR